MPGRRRFLRTNRQIVSLGDIDQEQAIEGEEREGGLAEATGDAVQAGDVEDDRLISEPTEDEAGAVG